MISVLIKGVNMIHMQLVRNDDLKALGVDDSKKLTGEQREAIFGTSKMAKTAKMIQF